MIFRFKKFAEPMMLSFLFTCGTIFAQAGFHQASLHGRSRTADEMRGQHARLIHATFRDTPVADPMPDAHGIYSPGAGIRYPVLLNPGELERTEQAKKANVRGEVVLVLVVDENGRPRNVRVTHGLGFGMDKAAMKCVRLYRFKPALLHGKAVPVRITLSLNEDWF